MKCPACERELERMDVGDIVVDVCRNGCGGIWFDNFELKNLDEQHEAAGEALLEIERDSTIKIDHSEIRACPKCTDVKMMKHFMSVKREVEIDECGGCGSVWLDCGELGKIRKQYTTEEDRSEAARVYFSELFDGDLAAMHEKSKAQLGKANLFARIFRFICPTQYIPGKQKGGAF